jgi:hypothetical protein
MTPFPQPVRINGRLFWSRSELEIYKQKLIGVERPATTEIEELVPAKTVAQEFGVGRRTLARRLAENGQVTEAPHQLREAR